MPRRRTGPKASKKGRRQRAARPGRRREPACLMSRPRNRSSTFVSIWTNFVAALPVRKYCPQPTEHGIEVRDDAADVLVTPRARRQLTHASADPRHRAWRRPALEVDRRVSASAPRPARSCASAGDTRGSRSPRLHARVDHPGLLRMQLEPQPGVARAHPTVRVLDLRLVVSHMTTKSSA